MCVGLCPPGPIVKAPKDGEVSSQIIGTAPSWPQRRPSYQHSPAVLRPPRLPSLLGHRQGPSQLSLSRAHGLQVLLPPTGEGGVRLRPTRQTQVRCTALCRSQVCCLQLMRRAVGHVVSKQHTGVCSRVRICHHVARSLPTYERKDPLAKQFTCRLAMFLPKP